MKFYQQGDVLIKHTKKIPSEAVRVRHTVLAEGEVTGHAHRASGEGVVVMEFDGTLFMDAPNGAEVTHEEHGPHTIPPGIYEIGIVKEYDHFAEEIREVAD